MVDRDLWREARQQSPLLGFTVALNTAVAVAIVAQAYLLSGIIAAVFLDRAPAGHLSGPLSFLLAVTLMRATLVGVAEGSAGLLAVRIKRSLRRRLMRHLQLLGPAFTQTERTGELVNTLGDGVEALDAYFSQYLPQLTIAVVTPLVVLVAVATGDLLSAFILLITAPLIPIFMILVGNGSKKVVQQQWHSLSTMSAHFLDVLQGLTTLKILDQSKAQIARVGRISRQYGEATLRVLRITFLSALVLELVATLSVAIIAVETGLRLLDGSLSFQNALFILILAPEFYMPLRMLGARFHAGMNGTAAARRIFALLQSPERPTGRHQSGPLPDVSAHCIRFRNVSVAFADGQRPALHDVSFDLRPGTHLAIVGQSGAGKSTLLHLLLGFMSPSQGQILIGDRSLTSLDAEKWLRQISWMPERPYLFHDTVAANIRLGCPEADDSAVYNAARQAGAHGFIAALPHGYETIIGEQGARLSQGQAQRLALARAFLKDARLFILDEPTANIDLETETIITDAVEMLSQHGTVITITHRLHTVIHADHVIVLHDGRVVQQGPPSRIITTDPPLVRPTALDTQRNGRRSHNGLTERTNTMPSSGNRRLLKPDSGVQEKLETISGMHAARKLLAFLGGQWVWVLVAVLLGALTVGSAIGLMAVSAYLLSAAALQPSIADLALAIVGVRFFGLARGVLRYLERLASHTLTLRLLADLRTWTFAALEPLAPARLSWTRSGDLLTRLVSDVTTLENFYVRALAPPAVAVLITVAVSALLAMFHWQLALAALLMLALAGAVLPLVAGLGSKRFSLSLISSRAALNTLLVDAVQGMADLTAYGHTEAYTRRVDGAVDRLARTQQQSSWHSAAQEGLTSLAANGAAWLVLFLAIPLVNSGQLDGVYLATVVMTALAAFEATNPLPLAAQHIESSFQAARRLFAVGTMLPAVSELSPTASASAKPHLEVRDLSFSYGPGYGSVLRDINLDLPPGRRLAIVGSSGAGKTTLAHLLLRFWDCRHNQVLLDGTTIHGFATGEVRRLFHVLTQNSYLFNASVGDNIRLANPKATRQEVIAAARKAQIHEFVASLPRGYETMIGERGVQLSGGQRQRLALARALLRPAPILLLDEPTANLDGETERALLETIHEQAASGSLILITHRLIGMERFDEIVVMEQGAIIERGQHSDLLQRGGLYARLWQLQQGAALSRPMNGQSSLARSFHPPVQSEQVN